MLPRSAPADQIGAARNAVLLLADRGSEASADIPTAAMEALLATPFGKALRTATMVGLYADIEVTRRFGYEGPSFEEGGYIDRGFNDLRWLPEPPLGGDIDG